MVHLNRSNLQYNEDYQSFDGVNLWYAQYITKIGPGYVYADAGRNHSKDYACLFQSGAYGLKVTHEGIFISQDTGLTWINLFNKIT